MNRGQLLSVVVPVYGSGPILPETHRRLTEALAALDDLDYEIIYVNDGSPDNAGEILREIVAGDGRARLLWLSRNFGHQAAITAGLDHASGDAVILIDTTCGTRLRSSRRWSGAGAKATRWSTACEQ